MAYMRYLKTTPRQRYDARCADIKECVHLVAEQERNIQSIRDKAKFDVQALQREAREAGSDPDAYDAILDRASSINNQAAADVGFCSQRIQAQKMRAADLRAKNERVLANVGGDERRLMK